MSRKVIGIANYKEGRSLLRLAVEIELRVGDLAGDLAPRGFQTIEHEPVEPGTLGLSITCTVTNRRITNGDPVVAFGAGLPTLPDDAIYDDGWSAERYAELRNIAERWHLNTMRAACAHQKVEYETDRVPSLDRTEPCPQTGYRYGSAWLVEPLPDEILDYLHALGAESEMAR